MTIAYISPHVDGYGADRSLLNNVIYLQSTGIKTIFIVPKNGLLIEYLEKENIDYIITPFKTWTVGTGSKPVVIAKAFYKIIINFFLAIKLALALKKREINIVHTNDLITPFGCMLALLIKAKHIMHSRALLKEQFGIEFDFGERLSLFFVNKFSKAFICNSKAVFEKYTPYLPTEKSYLIHSAIFFNRELVATNNKTANKVKFVFIGRYEDSKDPLTAIKACKILIDEGIISFHLDLFGKENEFYPDYLQSLKQYVADHHLGQYISFNGFDKNIASKIGDYNVGVFCSPIEGIARVLVEYMMNGLPVIGTNSGSTPDVIKDAYNGYLYQPRNSEELAIKMKSFINNKSTIEIIGNVAFNSVGQNFSAEGTSKQFMDIYNKVLFA